MKRLFSLLFFLSPCLSSGRPFQALDVEAPAQATQLLELQAEQIWFAPLWKGLRGPSDPHTRASFEAELQALAGEEAPATELSPIITEAEPSKPLPRPEARSKAEKLCVSIGKASRGWLINGLALKSTAQIIARKRNNYGTPEMLQAIKEATAAVFEKFPKTPKLVIGDLSRKGGGPLKPHKSHQSGRDADIGYFIKGIKQPTRLMRIKARQLDVPRTWTFISKLLENDQVEYLFIDYGLQKPLYKYAEKKMGLSKKRLLKLFAYPRGRRAHLGIIRHIRGHDTHMHLRFRSPIAVANVGPYIKKHGRQAIRPLPTYYKVRRGDSLYRIARRKKVRLKQLVRWNHINRRKILRPGDKLIVGWRRPRLPRF